MQNNKSAWKKLGIIVAFAVVIFFGWLAINWKTNLQAVKSNVTCAKEGETIGSCANCVQQCCGGLKAMARLKNGDKCINFPAPGSGATCSKCGDGICDKQNNEDECNCPEDCKSAPVADQQAAKSAQSDNQENTQTFTNTQYGFSLKISADWKGYTAKCAQVAKTDIGMQTCYFNLPKYDGVFNITIYTKSQWAQQQNEGMVSEEVLGQNKTYVYTFAQGALLAGGNTPTDDATLATQLKEVYSIKKSFTLIQN